MRTRRIETGKRTRKNREQGLRARTIIAWLFGGKKQVPSTRQNAKEYRLMIGYVKCTACECVWEALAYEHTLDRLECPECGARMSVPVDASIHQASRRD